MGIVLYSGTARLAARGSVIIAAFSVMLMVYRRHYMRMDDAVGSDRSPSYVSKRRCFRPIPISTVLFILVSAVTFT